MARLTMAQQAAKRAVKQEAALTPGDVAAPPVKKPLGEMTSGEKFSYFESLASKQSTKGQLTRVTNNIIEIMESIKSINGAGGIKQQAVSALTASSNFVTVTELRQSLKDHKAGSSSKLIEDLVFLTEGWKEAGFDVSAINRPGRTASAISKSIKQGGKVFYDKVRSDIWKRTAGAMATRIFDWLTPELKGKLMDDSKYFVIMRDDSYNSIDSRGLQAFQDENGGIELQAQRLIDWCEKNGIKIPAELLRERPDDKNRNSFDTMSDEDFFHSIFSGNNPGKAKF